MSRRSNESSKAALYVAGLTLLVVGLIYSFIRDDAKKEPRQSQAPPSFIKTVESSPNESPSESKRPKDEGEKARRAAVDYVEASGTYDGGPTDVWIEKVRRRLSPTLRRSRIEPPTVKFQTKVTYSELLYLREGEADVLLQARQTEHGRPPTYDETKITLRRTNGRWYVSSLGQE